jgi:M6 family metalloprotease-like protein
MKKKHTAYKTILNILCAFLISMAAHAAPYFGTEFKLKQPDASLVTVKVWGDEFYQRVESIDGYTLTRDTAGWITYAVLSADGNSLLPTGIIYTGRTATLPDIPKKIDINRTAADQIRAANRVRLNPPVTGSANQRSSTFREAAPLSGTAKGLAILIDFSDEPRAISRDSIERFFNETGYTDFGNNGSVHDYYWAVSNNQLNYTNAVLGYYRAIHPKTYYEDTINPHVAELIHEALTWADAQGFNFSTLSVEGSSIRAINLMYAGYPTMGWAKGLWPHAGGYNDFSADGVNSGAYQMTNIGETLTIATTCHENGHMLMHWPDLYDYDYNTSGSSLGIGNYCLMAYQGSSTNPVPPNAYLRIDAGWEDYTDITATTGTFATYSNFNQSYIINNPSNSNELFVIESRTRTGRSASLPDDGLLIWHIDKAGNNSANEMTEDRHFFVSLEQADGLFELEHDVNGGSYGDLYKAGYKTRFNDETLPDARWWNGAESGIRLHSVSAVGDTMTFKIGGPEQCTYGAPLATALPSISYKQYTHAYVLGDGGPDLSAVSLFAIHWDLQNNGLWNFSFNLFNTAPYYIDLKANSTHTFGSASPSVTLNNTGIAGLDGDYYVITNNGNFVLVNKNGDFTIYFSNDITPPACGDTQARMSNDATDVSAGTNLSPNPASESVQITSDLNLESATIRVVNEQGQNIGVPYTTSVNKIDVNISALAKGFYLVTVTQESTIAVKKLVVTK